MLDASHRWQSSYLREVAIHNLEKLKLAPSIRLALSKKYGIDEWVESVCAELCRRQQPLADHESAALGEHRATALGDARRGLLLVVCSDLLTSCSQINGSCANARMQRAQNMLKLLQESPGVQGWSDIIDEATNTADTTILCVSCLNKRGQWQRSWTDLVVLKVRGIMQLPSSNSSATSAASAPHESAPSAPPDEVSSPATPSASLSQAPAFGGPALAGWGVSGNTTCLELVSEADYAETVPESVPPDLREVADGFLLT